MKTIFEETKEEQKMREESLERIDIAALQKKVEEEWEENIFQTDLKKAKPYIYAAPMLVKVDGPDDDPAFKKYGYRWEFYLMDEYDEWGARGVTFDMQATWYVKTQKLQETAIRNIREYADYAEYALLFGKAAKHTTIPVLNVYLPKEAGYASYYGASLILLDEVVQKVKEGIGDFILYMEDQESFYAVPVEMLERFDLNPDEAIKNIFVNDLYEQPMVFRPAELLEPNSNLF